MRAVESVLCALMAVACMHAYISLLANCWVWIAAVLDELMVKVLPLDAQFPVLYTKSLSDAKRNYEAGFPTNVSYGPPPGSLFMLLQYSSILGDVTRIKWMHMTVWLQHEYTALFQQVHITNYSRE